jgi:hypothetical protein
VTWSDKPIIFVAFVFEYSKVWLMWKLFSFINSIMISRISWKLNQLEHRTKNFFFWSGFDPAGKLTILSTIKITHMHMYLYVSNLRPRRLRWRSREMCCQCNATARKTKQCNYYVHFSLLFRSFCELIPRFWSVFRGDLPTIWIEPCVGTHPHYESFAY